VSTYRPEFVGALELMAEAFDEVVAAGFERPIIVGGAAVEFYTGGAVVSQRELEAALLRRGFERPAGPGTLLRGVHHSSLGIGVEVVSGQLFDGAADKMRVRVVSVGSSEVRLPPVEDMIADRMGQFAAPDLGDQLMLRQAIILYRIARRNLEDPLDQDYLDSRIRQETLGHYDLGFLAEKADEADHT
jgi:hypothetical protein